MGETDSTKEVFEYIQKVEDMRHCEDPVAAAAIASQNHFTLDHVPGHLLTAQDVSLIYKVLKLSLLSGTFILGNTNFVQKNSIFLTRELLH